MSVQEQIRRLDAEGVPARQIARDLGVSRDSVAKYVAEQDFSPRPVVVRRRPEIVLRGAAVGLGPAGGDGVLFNLTLGIHLAEAVREFGLTEGDFSAADLAIELLYMGEANAGVLGELSALTGRLDSVDTYNPASSCLTGNPETS